MKDKPVERHAKALDSQKCADSITNIKALHQKGTIENIYDFKVWHEQLTCGILTYVNDKIPENLSDYLKAPDASIRPDEKITKFIFGVLVKKVSEPIFKEINEYISKEDCYERAMQYLNNRIIPCNFVQEHLIWMKLVNYVFCDKDPEPQLEVYKRWADIYSATKQRRGDPVPPDRLYIELAIPKLPKNRYGKLLEDQIHKSNPRAYTKDWKKFRRYLQEI